MRSLSDPAFWLIAATMLCGLANVPALLALPAGVVGLQALSLPKYLRLHDRAKAAGAEAMWWRTLSMSIAWAVIISGCSYGFGRFCWGGLGLRLSHRGGLPCATRCALPSRNSRRDT